MYKKKIRRPLRIFLKTHKPYIIYKDKKYNIKSTEIKDMLKFINKLHKKSIKKIQTDLKPKRQIKNYLDQKIRLEGGPVQTVQNLNLEKDTFKINELNKKIENKKQQIKAIEQKQNKDVNIIKNIKAIEDLKIDDLINYNKKDDKYILKTNYLEIIGNDVEDIKNKLDQGYDNLQNDFKKLENEKKKIEEDKKKLQEDKDNYQSLSDLQKKSLSLKNVKIKKLDYFKDRSTREKEYNNISVKNLNKKLDDYNKIKNYNSVEFKETYNKFYNKNKNVINKNDLIDYLIDYEDYLISKNPKPVIEEQKEEEEENIEIIPDVQGDGKKNNNFGLWNNQIDKIMNPFKLFIKSITMNELDEMIKYIYDNNIKIGSFILNTGNHWVAIYFDFEKEYVLEYYDPFGDYPKQSIIHNFKNLISKYNIEVFVKFKINGVQQQDVKSSNCGWFSMYFLIMRYNNYPFKYITKFKDIKSDEKNIENLKDKYDKFGFI